MEFELFNLILLSYITMNLSCFVYGTSFKFQLNNTPIKLIKKWWAHRDSNPGQTDYESATLTN